MMLNPIPLFLCMNPLIYLFFAKYLVVIQVLDLFFFCIFIVRWERYVCFYLSLSLFFLCKFFNALFIPFLNSFYLLFIIYYYFPYFDYYRYTILLYKIMIFL